MNAREWLARDAPDFPELTLVGAPVSRASISPSQAWSTPPAFRAALERFPTWEAEHEVDISELSARDLGDVADDRQDPDAAAGRGRIQEACTLAAAPGGTVVVIGGDNSVTVPAMQALMQSRPEERWGLITVDAHHDCRPLDRGPSNGTVVRELVEAGLPGSRVVQMGIHPLGNDQESAAWARQQGVHVFPVHDFHRNGPPTVMHEAHLVLSQAGVSSLYVDFDIDSVDRAFAPACPASLPGGLLPFDLIQLARHLGNEFPVAAADITEVDASADVAGVTVRLAAAVFLSFCAGFATRQEPRRRT